MKIVTMSVCLLMMSLLFVGKMSAGRVYYFDEDAECRAIDQAESWQQLLPHIIDQVRLHLYCAERSEVDLHNYEYFCRDWDDPLVAAGQPKEPLGYLIEKITTLNKNSLAVVDSYAYSRGKDDEALDDQEVKRIRRERLDQLCRSWLMMNGSFSSNTAKDKVSLTCIARSYLVQPGSPVKELDEDACEEIKNELLTVAQELRWFHELSTKGMSSLVRCLMCGEKFLGSDTGRVPELSRSLARFVNGHLDQYGVTSTLSEGVEAKDFEEVKLIVQDSVKRFKKLLALSFVSIVQTDKVQKKDSDDEWDTLTTGSSFNPFFQELSSRQLAKREIFAGHLRSMLDRQKRPQKYSPRGQSHVLRRSSAADRSLADRSVVDHGADWRPPTVAEKVWKRLKLIDEIRFGSIPVESSEESGTDPFSSSSSVDSEVLTPGSISLSSCKHFSSADLLPPPEGL